MYYDQEISYTQPCPVDISMPATLERFSPVIRFFPKVGTLIFQTSADRVTLTTLTVSANGDSDEFRPLTTEITVDYDPADTIDTIKKTLQGRPEMRGKIVGPIMKTYGNPLENSERLSAALSPDSSRAVADIWIVIVIIDVIIC